MFLRIDPDPADKRIRRLTATEVSDRYWRARDTADFAAVVTWFAALTPDELDTLIRLAAKVLAD
ncbi:hypothetical protein AB0C34_21230 [Nocardia sp. NPDC049220]|uniref:hypothetical protein n=1 Tax=Nocardia sp. NPDC049220 TaxID=3155273 RepID=UPI0033FAEB15